ncbi:MAG: hypothetical protein AAF969_12195 [Bacteroidota bacterium]
MDKDKNLEKLIDQLMQEVPLEAPSIDFTAKVVEKVENAAVSKVKYKSLISWKAMVFVMAGLALSLWYAGSWNGSLAQDGSHLATYLNTAGSWASQFLSQFQFSKSFSYSIAAIGAMICFQSLLLKRYFTNRLVS